MKRLLWFRRDLRIEDNPLLKFDAKVLPIFIFDVNVLSSLNPKDKRVSYIFDCVTQLKEKLKKKGLDLKVFFGEPVAIIKALHALHNFDEVVASGDFDTYAKERDRLVSHILHFRYLQDTYIFKHDEVMKNDGTPYYVFTPFYKKALGVLEHKSLDEVQVGNSLLIEENFEGIFTLGDKSFESSSHALESIGFQHYSLSILPVEIKLQKFIKKLPQYEQKRDFLSAHATSNLSLELRFGVIGVRQLLRAILPLENSAAFIRQLIFRDFYAYLLFHIPTLQTYNYKYKFNGLEDKQKYQLFCEAKTGVPIVDAGVRELLQTGNMQNRVRMIIASFFTKDLLLPWQWGESFFAEHLLDYDKASNVLSWQWSAGTGVDPQPYFRVFNPYLQSKKFDKEGFYIKQYLSELSSLEAKYLHDEAYLFSHNIVGYPKPMVHHKEAAKIAIESFKH
jgi:deoxyribodipyrimidine photo-lyase